ncbi:hypothetical protein BDV28DRAFT_161900 [Aspergillus coremiiformis]|uniref:DUF221-domain-containing protein n=1 Tax=Aspergillus coremiiformis TaxID=138285 RepID=A0A5N6Z551_9EURO|nr:hypothetical protein BDV28DRAFT_161900 [Aspergillus coremiiformis]
MAEDLGKALEHAGGTGHKSEGISINTFLASLGTAIVIFAVEFLLFLLLKSKLTRIYQPRTYLVPDRERTEPSPPGLFRWIGPVFHTSSTEFIQKCGLDAYFFLRYLRMLLKIFLPLGCIILPVLLPLNKAGGKDQNFWNATASGGQWNVTGLDQLAWSNVTPENTSRYWGHLIMAIITILYVCAVFYDELRNYIRLRQAYLTSPQHRLRASATTVLVTAIPERWLTVEALDALFDVFPGGIRNIWINRNFDDLNEKVKLRDALALKLEAAETELIIKCKKAQLKQEKALAKKSGAKPSTAGKQEKTASERKASLMAMDAGISSGDPHQAHTLAEVLHHDGTSNPQNEPGKRKRMNPFDPALEAAGAVGHGVGKLRKSVIGGFRKVEGGIDGTLARSGGFVPDASVAARDGAHVVEGAGPGRGPCSIDYPRSESDSMDLADCSQAHAPGTTSSTTDVVTGSKPKRPFWKGPALSNSRTRNRGEADELPLTRRESNLIDEDRNNTPMEKEKIKRDKRRARTEGEQLEGEKYPSAYNEDFDNEDFGEPLWKKHIRPKDRDTMRLPIFDLSWMPSLPLLGKKVDTIDYCRKEVARLNLEIEVDQQHPEKFPLMNSAFIQFNHQVAAHMACQAVSHHVPKQMAPRIVEISPDDVIWDNMSIRWWERYLRTFGILAIVCAMVVGWAFPVAFTGLLSQLSYLEEAFTWLQWISKLPEWFVSAVQGILPALFLAILMAILPLILRFLCRTQGLHTGMAVELTVQNYYFAFLFVQLFLVVAISSSFSTIINNVTNFTSWPQLLAENIPLSSNYFFSYMILQAMSVSAGALVQVVNLASWFILGPLLDTTARTKWARTTNLNQMQWGTFFPVYTTLASIGLIYCVISPLILVFNVITFGLFWFVYRYNTLYVTKFRFDTGGLLFPKAINQLFTGIYFMEVSLIGLFFLVRDVQGSVACKGQAICMIVVLILTVGYQILLNDAFGPLIRYLPITLEDDAVRRDEEFERAQRARLGLLQDDELNSDERQPSDHERHRGRPSNQASHDIELKDIEAGIERRAEPQARRPSLGPKRQSWADRSSRGRSKYFGANSDNSVPTVQRIREKIAEDAEAQGAPTKQVGQALFAGIHDELEDLTPEERDQLVQRAFQHDALRAKRPVIWIPRDDLGVSDDEVYRTQRFSKHIWISNEYQALDGKCRTIFSRSPPDFSEVDLIQL